MDQYLRSGERKRVRLVILGVKSAKKVVVFSGLSSVDPATSPRENNLYTRPKKKKDHQIKTKGPKLRDPWPQARCHQKAKYASLL